MTEQQMRMKSRGMVGGILILTAVLQLLFFILLAQHLYPNYNLSSNYISDLGVGSTAVIFNTSVELFGLLLMASSYFIHKAGYSYPSLTFMMAGMGGLCVGIFTETAGALHLIAAAIAFGAVAMAAFVFFRILNGYLSYYSLASGLLALSALALLAFNLSAGTNAAFGLASGGLEETLFYGEAAWAVVIGFCFATKRI